MNQVFSTWSRQVAFNLTLTEPAIQELLFQLHCHRDCVEHNKNPRSYPSTFYDRSLMGYLLRRGLIEPLDTGGFNVSKTGLLVAELMEEAGFTPNKTYGTMFPNTTANQPRKS